MKHKLTDALIAALPAGEQTIFDSQLAGFGVRVSDAGVKSFFTRVQVGGRRPKVTFDRFPDLTVAQARVIALQLLADQRRGLDPRRSRGRPSSGLTVAAFAERWMAEVVRVHNKPRTIADYETLLAKHILPTLGHLPVAAVTRDDVVGLHTAMAHTRRQANYVLSTVRTLFNIAIDAGLRPAGSNPVRRIRWYRERKIERFLTEAEIARAAEGIAAAEQAGPDRSTRRGRVAARVADRRPFRRDHRGAVDPFRSGSQAASAAGQQDQRAAHHPPVRRRARGPARAPADRTLHRRRRQGGRAVQEPGRAWIVARKLAGLDDVRLHDLRHSYASLAAGRGVSLQMIGKLLGHKVPATTQRYAHLARDAAAAVNDELGAVMAAAIEKGAPQPASVVKLAASALGPWLILTFSSSAWHLMPCRRRRATSTRSESRKGSLGF